MRFNFKYKKGQSILEYAVLLSLTLAVIVASQIYVKRAVEGKFKQSADQIGEQFTTAQDYTIETISQSAREEKTVVGSDDLKKEWSRSQIKDANVWTPDEKKAEYKGYEVTKTDYVTATEGAGAVGTHATFDSGKLSEKKLFEDD